MNMIFQFSLFIFISSELFEAYTKFEEGQTKIKIMCKIQAFDKKRRIEKFIFEQVYRFKNL